MSTLPKILSKKLAPSPGLKSRRPRSEGQPSKPPQERRTDGSQRAEALEARRGAWKIAGHGAPVEGQLGGVAEALQGQLGRAMGGPWKNLRKQTTFGFWDRNRKIEMW